MKRILLSGLCFILLATGVSAQQNTKVKKDTLKSALDTTAKVLQEIRISSRYYRRYNLNKSSAALKLGTPLLQLPQNIQEIDQRLMADQQAITINESVTRNVSGALRNNNADLYNSSVFMRGAQITPMRNGMDLSMIYAGPSAEDAAIIDRVEFIKGPSSYINGLFDPAGSYNVLTKQPTGTPNHQIGFTTGSFNLYRLSADLDGNIDKAGKWQYRLNALGQKSESFQKYNFNDKFVIDPVIRYNINDHADVSAEYLFQDQRFQQYFATVFAPDGFASLPVDFTINDPNKVPFKSIEHNGFLTYHNTLSKNWHLTVNAAYARDHLEGTYFFVSRYNAAQPNLIMRRATYERLNTDVLAIQPYVSGEFSTGTVSHQLLGGVDINRKKFISYSGSGDPTANQTLYPLDTNKPVYGIPFDPNVRTGALSEIATDQQAISYQAAYVQDELGMFENKLRVTLAARLTFSKTGVQKSPVKTSLGETKNTAFTPKLGLSYSLTADFSVYALSDQTFTPQSGVNTTSGEAFKPLKGKNLEAGLKKDWMEGKWNTTVSLYRIIRDNVKVTDPSTNIQSQLGQTISKGIEFDLKGEMVKGLNTVINYAYTDSHISTDENPARVGLVTPFRVKHIQNTWLNYLLPIEQIKGLAISSGYQLQIGRAGRYELQKLELAPIFRLDGGVTWSHGHFSVNGIVNNILNRFNYGSAWITPSSATIGTYAYVPYAPREFRLNVGYKF
ncbi:TonB-dependent siderophore receptor [Pedobacter zeae]|uniref:Ferrichrome-iron receptor n=1 Tax=Pedobacter zeae TaxID=1737356 RepID=A0A7W6P825_9SPHI|nr:TonB-dependent siderophore receptor [Pedobacter zeae]MBB4109641.1 iron complex outermembrane receptor protein [Pedobacter zeae]GGH13391.1 ferrichrome-iron receptor [Pedobacter zeae]